MAKVAVTYNAPEGDSPVVEYMGVRFFDGIPVELDKDENAYLLSKADGNPFFDVEGSTKVKRRRKAAEAPAEQSEEHQE